MLFTLRSSDHGGAPVVRLPSWKRSRGTTSSRLNSEILRQGMADHVEFEEIHNHVRDGGGVVCDALQQAGNEDLANGSRNGPRVLHHVGEQRLPEGTSVTIKVVWEKPK